MFSALRSSAAAACRYRNSFQGTVTRPESLRRLIHVEKRLEEIGITLPAAPGPKANYNIVCHATGNMMYVSGHLPVKPDGSIITGRIDGSSKDIEYGYEAARHAGLNIISTLKKELGDLDRVEKVVKVRQMHPICFACLENVCAICI